MPPEHGPRTPNPTPVGLELKSAMVIESVRQEIRRESLRPKKNAPPSMALELPTPRLLAWS